MGDVCRPRRLKVFSGTWEGARSGSFSSLAYHPGPPAATAETGFPKKSKERPVTDTSAKTACALREGTCLCPRNYVRSRSGTPAALVIHMVEMPSGHGLWLPGDTYSRDTEAAPTMKKRHHWKYRCSTRVLSQMEPGPRRKEIR